MGYGDKLISAGLAHDLYAVSRTPVTLVDVSGKPRWNPVWAGNPAIVVPVRSTPRFNAPYILTGKGQHPYIAERVDKQYWKFADWRVRDHRPGYFLSAEDHATIFELRRQFGSYLLLEPTPLRKHPNRRPTHQAFWPELFDRLRLLGLPILQLIHGEADYQLLPGAIQITNHSFRHACAVLAGASLLVTTEGGLPHAAAALSIPSVVLFGGMISVDCLGYPEHENLSFPDAGTPCGRLDDCAHCLAAWAYLSPDHVAGATQAYWRRITHEVDVCGIG